MNSSILFVPHTRHMQGLLRIVATSAQCRRYNYAVTEHSSTAVSLLLWLRSNCCVLYCAAGDGLLYLAQSTWQSYS